MSTKTILLTGATGLVGTALVDSLLQKGYLLHVLTTRKPLPRKKKSLHFFHWDPAKGELDIQAMEGVTDIIHLAGASIAEKSWTAKRKIEILESRTKSAALLLSACKRQGIKLQSFISASAIGFYGDRGNQLLTEKELSGSDFLAEVCKAWEHAAWQFQDVAERVCVGRIGIVLDRSGGALPELMRTMPFGIAGYFTKKPLFTSWIHLRDLVSAFCFLLEQKKTNGCFNLTAPQPVEHIDLISALRNTFHPAALLMPVPTIALTLSMGERATLVLTSQRCSAEKIIQAGFSFQYPSLLDALPALPPAV
jgi:uncharacterized protein (TIGR01777 family)